MRARIPSHRNCPIELDTGMEGGYNKKMNADSHNRIDIHMGGPKSRKEKEYRTRRTEILEAAERLFAERGFHGATMSDLASVSEFSVGTLYKFFKSKEEIYYLLILEKLDLFNLKLATEVDRHPAGVAQIRELIEGSLDFFQTNREFFKIFILERANLESSAGATLAGELGKKYWTTITIFKRVMEKAILAGDIQKSSPQDLAYALVGILNSFAQHSILFPQPGELRLKGPFIYRLFLTGIIGKGLKEDAA
jgi:TetR/AcrR family transcriptional regulator